MIGAIVLPPSPKGRVAHPSCQLQSILFALSKFFLNVVISKAIVPPAYLAAEPYPLDALLDDRPTLQNGHHG